MLDGRTDSPADRGLTRRDFLTKGLVARLSGVLGGPVAAARAHTAEAADGRDPVGDLVPEDLRPMSRDGVRAAIDRIRCRGGHADGGEP